MSKSIMNLNSLLHFAFADSYLNPLYKTKKRIKKIATQHKRPKWAIVQTGVLFMYIIYLLYFWAYTQVNAGE